MPHLLRVLTTDAPVGSKDPWFLLALCYALPMESGAGVSQESRCFGGSSTVAFRVLGLVVVWFCSGCSPKYMSHTQWKYFVLFVLYSLCTGLPAAIAAASVYGRALRRHDFGEEEKKSVRAAVSRTTLAVLSIPLVLFALDLFSGRAPGKNTPFVMMIVAAVAFVVFSCFFYLLAGVLAGIAGGEGARLGFGFYSRWACALTAGIAAILGPFYLIGAPLLKLSSRTPRRSLEKEAEEQ